MGPAEIVASLKELCAEKGPRLGTEDIVAWIERIGGFETNAELVAFAKKMKARQYARMLEYEDEDSGMRIKRLWSFHDQALGRRFYADILEMPAEDRKRFIRQYTRFQKQIRAVRRAMADYFAGQRFFDFYSDEPEEEEAEFELKPTRSVAAARGASGEIGDSAPDFDRDRASKREPVPAPRVLPVPLDRAVCRPGEWKRRAASSPCEVRRRENRVLSQHPAIPRRIAA